MTSANGDCGARGKAAGSDFRVGIGFDIHRLVPGGALVLGGVEVPCELALEGHSDADVVLHALVDALLGAASAGDIGEHFPPEDERWKDADSAVFVDEAVRLVRSRGYGVGNVDVTVFLEHPRLAEYKEQIRERIAGLLACARDQVNIKAKTAEGLGPVGAGEAAACQAIVMLKGEAERAAD